MRFWQPNFRYVDTIRKPNGELRNWEDYDCLSKIEAEIDGSRQQRTHHETDEDVIKKHELIQVEYEKRS